MCEFDRTVSPANLCFNINLIATEFISTYLKEGSDLSNILKVPQNSCSGTSRNFELNVLNIYHRVAKSAKLSKSVIEINKTRYFNAIEKNMVT